MVMQPVSNRAEGDHYSYITFYNYFRSIEVAFQAHDINSSEKLISAMKAQNKGLNRKNPITDENCRRLRQSLFHSWNSQIHLHQYRDIDPDYIAICLQWLPTMFYYTFYHCLQAYFAASGKAHTPTHMEALRVMSRDCGRFPKFMGARCIRSFQQPQFESLDLSASGVTELSNLAKPDLSNFSLHLARLLRTTRNQILEEGYEEKRRRLRRKKLTTDQKAEVDLALGQTCIAHFLYRMRKRFNYEDGEIVHRSDSTNISPVDMHKAIRNSYLGYSYSLEWMAAAYAGKNHFNLLFDEFKGRVKSQLASEAISRLESRFQFYF